MLLNNKAHSLFLSNKLPYYKIIEFIVYNLKKEIKNKITFNDFNDIIKFISLKIMNIKIIKHFTLSFFFFC